MPVHLESEQHRAGTPGAPTLTRRAWLALAAAAGAPLLWAGPRRTRIDQTWALLSDLHISAAAERRVRGECMAETLRRVVDDVARAGVDRVLLNGDLACDTGEAADYAALGGLIAPLRKRGLPLHVTIGNHDHRHRCAAALAGDLLPPVAERLASARTIGGLRWVLLDSLDEVGAVRGELGAAQRAWLAQELDAPGPPTIVCVHHNLDGLLFGLKDGPQLLDLLLSRRRVKLVLYGHLHVYHVWQKAGLHFVNLPAVGYRLYDPLVALGWVRARLDERGGRLEFRGVRGRHAPPAQTLRWRRDA